MNDDIFAAIILNSEPFLIFTVVSFYLVIFWGGKKLK